MLHFQSFSYSSAASAVCLKLGYRPDQPELLLENEKSWGQRIHATAVNTYTRELAQLPQKP